MSLEIRVKNKLLFVNVGELSKSFLKIWVPRPTAQRNWENSREFGFITAGQGKKYRDQIKKIDIGDVFVLMLMNMVL